MVTIKIKGEIATENKNIVIVKHHPRPLTLSNPFYLTQCPDIEDRVMPLWRPQDTTPSKSTNFPMSLFLSK